ncbi:hypothetical protein OC835_007971, partial [Tilletia horrida]
SQVESNWKWLKYVPDGVIRTAQAAEWKMQAWRLGKQPSLAYEGVGFDARAAANAAATAAATAAAADTANNEQASGSGNASMLNVVNPGRKSGEDSQSQGHSSGGHGGRGSKDGSRTSLDSISGAYATYTRVFDLNAGDVFSSISEEEGRPAGDASSVSASASPSPAPSSYGATSSNGAGAASFDSAGARSSMGGGSGKNGSGLTAPASPASLHASSAGSRWAGSTGHGASTLNLPSPSLQPPEPAAPRKVVKKKSSKFGAFFGTSGAASTASLGSTAKARENSTVLNEQTSMGPSIVRTGADGRKRTTSLSRMRYIPDREDAVIELIEDDIPPAGRPRRTMRSSSVTSLVLPSSRHKDVPPLPPDAHLRYSVASLPPSSSTNSLDGRASLPSRPTEEMRRSLSASVDRPLVSSGSVDSNMSNPLSTRTTSSTSLRTLMRMPGASASMVSLDRAGRNSFGPGQSTPFLPRAGAGASAGASAGIGLGLPASSASASAHEPHNTSLGSLQESAANTSVLSRRSGSSTAPDKSVGNTTGNTTSSSSSGGGGITDLATALLRASHAESLCGGTADLMAILGRSSRPWGFTYTDVEHPVKVWHGDRDERISLSSAQWMEQELKN